MAGRGEGNGDTRPASITSARTVLPVTQHAAATDQLLLRARQQAAVARLGLAALRGLPLRELAQEAAQLVLEMLDADEAAIFERVADEGLLLRVCVPHRPDLTNRLMLKPGAGSQSGYTLQTNEPVVVSDLREETRFSRELSPGEPNVVGALTVVVQGKGRQFGVLGAYTQEPRSFSDEDVSFAQAIANVLGSAVERRLVERELRRSANRLRLAQDAGRMGIWDWDVRSGNIVWSESLEQLFGIPPGGFEGTLDDFFRRVHPDDAPSLHPKLEDALMAGGYEAEHRIIRDDTGEVRWVVARGERVQDDAGETVALTGICVDITERKAVEAERFDLLERERAARAAAERARERLVFLGEATNALSASLEYRRTLHTVARLAVPRFADSCVVDLLTDGVLSQVTVAHVDAEKEALIRELRRRYPVGVRPTDPVRSVLDGAPSILSTDVDEALLAHAAVDEQHLDMLRRLEARSEMCVPLRARGRVLGTMRLSRSRGRVQFDRDDLGLAEELARRVALAIDNARLFEELTSTGERYRHMAETLQASLLPPHLPSVPGIDVASGYRAAAQETTVGGDFYDVFGLPDGGWGVAIGDVQGKGTEAATLTALARHTLRTAAMQQGPDETLRVLNEVYLAHNGEDEPEPRFCTVLYGQLEPGQPGGTAGEASGALLTLVSGGHPPALLRRADGCVQRVGGGGMLVGVWHDAELHRETVALARGDAMLLYTDGVIEARGDQGEFGEGRLAEVLRMSSGTDAAGLVARVEEAVLSFSHGRIRDDIALLALRLEG